MFCQKCGNPLQPGERFCTKCGAPNQQPQQPQQPQQQPQQQYQQQYQQPQQQYQPQQAYAPKAPTDKKKLFGLLVTILFGTAALFLLVSMIGLCAKGGSPGAGYIISDILAILGCIGIALAPLFNKYTKFIVAASSAALFLGMYGVSTIFISGSVGFLFLMLGFACLSIVCWLNYSGNHYAKLMWLGFIPAGLIFVGSLINWIVGKYFSFGMKVALVYYLFDFLAGLVIIGAAVILGLYLIEIFNDKAAKFSIPNPGQKPQRPQQPQQQPPYQGQ